MAPSKGAYRNRTGVIGSARGQLRVLRRVVTDLVPAGLVGNQLVKARFHIEVGHQSRRDEVHLTEVVEDARPAVAAEVPRRELARVGLDLVLALGEPEVLLRHDHPREARAGPSLATPAMAVAHRLGILDLVLHASAQA